MARQGWASAVIFGLAACTTVLPNPETDAADLRPSIEFTTTAADGATVFGTGSFGELPNSAPLIVLFHQGGSNARAEYAPLIPWLNESGYRVIAWDLRVGGGLYGLTNRTANARLPEKPTSYCEGFPDMQAALEASLEHSASGRAVIWGSSYSGALVFHLAAEVPQKISRVIAASPANGPPMVDCLPQARLSELQTPAFVLSPAMEVTTPADFEENERYEQAGVNVVIVPDGIHGSSMLVDARTGADMSEARATVITWLTEDQF